MPENLCTTTQKVDVLTIQSVTNLYLYGQLTTPKNLMSQSLIRPKACKVAVIVDKQKFMSGP